jgi:hypothetical protein
MRPPRNAELLARLGIAMVALASAARADQTEEPPAAPPSAPAALSANPSRLAFGANPAGTTFGADVGVESTDNIGLTAADRTGQRIATTDLDFATEQATRRLDFNLKGAFSYLDYLEGAYGSDLIGRFDGIGQFALIPERLTWTVQDDFGQGQLNAFQPPTPNNKQNINYVSTGPNAFLRFGGTGFVDLSARYARVQYSDSPFDSNRYQASAKIGEQLSARSDVSVDIDTEHAAFVDPAAGGNFERSSAYLHYDLSGARTTIGANLGATKLAETGSSSTGALAKLAVDRKVSPSATLSLTLGRELTDASTGFSTAQSGAIGGIAVSPAAVTANSYTDDYGSLAFQYQRRLASFRLSGRWEKDSYADQPQLDVTRDGGEFSLDERLTRRWTAQVLSSYYESRYAHGDFTATQGATSFTDALFGAGLSFRAGRALLFQLRYARVSRSVSGAADAQGYRANTIFLTVGYRPLTAGSEAD